MIHRESELLGVKHSQKLLQKVTEIKPQRETQNTISVENENGWQQFIKPNQERRGEAGAGNGRDLIHIGIMASSQEATFSRVWTHTRRIRRWENPFMAL